jgi:WD40 repeat protein
MSSISMPLGRFKLIVLLLAAGCQSQNWSLLAPRDDPAPVNAIVVSADQSLAIVAGGKFNGRFQQPMPGFSFILNLRSGQMDRQLPNQGDGISSAVFLDDDRSVIAGSYDASFMLAELTAAHQTRIAWQASGPITAMAAAPSGKFFAAAAWLGNSQANSAHILLCDRNAQLIRRFDLGSSPVKQIAFSPDGQTLAACDTDDGDVTLIDIHSGRSTVLSHGYDGRAAAIEFLRDGRLLVGGRAPSHMDSSGFLQIWDIESQRILAQAHCDAAVLAIACAQDAKVVAAACAASPAVRFWNLADLSPSTASADAPDRLAIVKLIDGGAVLLYATDAGVIGVTPVHGVSTLKLDR